MTKREERGRALLQAGYTCALIDEDKALCSKSRGVAPLCAWLQSGECCDGMLAVDKVVGKAAAFLYVLLGVEKVYALVLSESAEKVFLQFGIAYAFEEKVAAIRNRAGDGFCPMEQAVLAIDEPKQAYQEICRTLQSLKENKK